MDSINRWTRALIEDNHPSRHLSAAPFLLTHFTFAFVTSMGEVLCYVVYLIRCCLRLETAPPRPPLPYGDAPPMRPPPPETDDEDDVFKRAPSASQPIMVFEVFRIEICC